MIPLIIRSMMKNLVYSRPWLTPRLRSIMQPFTVQNESCRSFSMHAETKSWKCKIKVVSFCNMALAPMALAHSHGFRNSFFSIFFRSSISEVFFCPFILRISYSVSYLAGIYNGNVFFTSEFALLIGICGFHAKSVQLVGYGNCGGWESGGMSDENITK